MILKVIKCNVNVKNCESNIANNQRNLNTTDSVKSCRNFILNCPSTYNVRTLFQTGKFHQLHTGCQKVGIDFLAIQEHRLIIEGEYEIEQRWSSDRNYLFVFSSADKKRNGGVGFFD